MTIGNRNILLSLMVLFALLPAELSAQDIEMTSEVSEQAVSIGRPFTLTVTITGSDAADADEPVLDPLPDFTVELIGTSRNISIINLTAMVTLTYTYSVEARAVGTFYIGAATVTMGGKTFSAMPTTVRVYASSPPQQRPYSGRTMPSSPPEDDDNIVVIASTDKKEAYIGEQVTYTFELLSRINTTNFEYMPPETTGFWTVELQKISPSTKMYQNLRYNSNVLKTALFPTASGELTIGSASITFRQGVGFFRTGPSRTLSTDPITIAAKPLPVEGKPSGFSGAVGSFRIAAVVERDTVQVGDVVIIHLTVTGDGNLDLISSLTEPELSAYRTYSPRIFDTITNSGFTIGGAKTWEYVIIPRQQGHTVVEPFSLSFFNPADEQYHTASTEPIELTVLAGSQASAGGSSVNQQNAGHVRIASDIRFLKPDKTSLQSMSPYGNDTWLFSLLYLIPAGIFITSVHYKKRRDKIERDRALKRRLHAWKTAQNQLKEAHTILAQNDEKAFCGKLYECITGYIGDMLNIDTGAQTIKNLEQILTDHGVLQEQAQNLRKILEMCDFVRFSSTGTKHDVHETILQETAGHLNRLRNLR
ncbi:BatD family protein [Candidatus Latescibacterota bacterium]